MFSSVFHIHSFFWVSPMHQWQSRFHLAQIVESSDPLVCVESSSGQAGYGQQSRGQVGVRWCPVSQRGPVLPMQPVLKAKQKCLLGTNRQTLHGMIDVCCTAWLGSIVSFSALFIHGWTEWYTHIPTLLAEGHAGHISHSDSHHDTLSYRAPVLMEVATWHRLKTLVYP